MFLNSHKFLLQIVELRFVKLGGQEIAHPAKLTVQEEVPWAWTEAVDGGE